MTLARVQQFAWPSAAKDGLRGLKPRINVRNHSLKRIQKTRSADVKIFSSLFGDGFLELSFFHKNLKIKVV